ncbi:DUF5345 family protein [Oceanobacillus sp. CFH 90083]|uniref:DUF5345 family protein n=1 Tax=Oceanobacillus sp. CFH 90083 TaxID=2592336 RepID=UPI00128D49F5|nr:DUF5345 family protein [Oceanobacillus sp. CFH 90083]
MDKKKQNASIVSDLQRDWQKIDQLAEDSFVNEHAIAQEMERFQQKRKRRFYKELAAFIATALLLLSLLGFLLVRTQLFFIILQIGTLLAGLIILFWLYRKETERERQWEK